MKALIQWIQIGNHLSTSYKQNASTDTATVVGGISISAAVFAVLTTLAVMNPALGITAELIATVTAIVGGTGSQVIPWVKHWFDQRAAVRQAESKLRIDGSAFAEQILADRTVVTPENPAPVDRNADSQALCVSWVGNSGKRYATAGTAKTLGVLIDDFAAVEVTLADGRVWVRS